MAGVQVVTRKLVEFQGQEEEFSNVYNFGDGILGGGSTGAEVRGQLGAAVVEAEQAIFATEVEFLGYTTYDLGPLGGAIGNTSEIVELPANARGTATTSTNMYRECALDIKWFLGRNRYLRSLLHTCANQGLQTTGVGTGIPAAALVQFAERMLDGEWPGGFNRIAPNGDRPDRYVINRNMEHRQFHRYRRRRGGILGG